MRDDHGQESFALRACGEIDLDTRPRRCAEL
ncbi:hypothetical protein J2S46_000526 [Kitasatospora herbaricolor]|nr:hypothetical protein [Kitasatospora herbaricolor]